MLRMVLALLAPTPWQMFLTDGLATLVRSTAADSDAGFAWSPRLCTKIEVSGEMLNGQHRVLGMMLILALQQD